MGSRPNRHTRRRNAPRSRSDASARRESHLAVGPDYEDLNEDVVRFFGDLEACIAKRLTGSGASSSSVVVERELVFGGQIVADVDQLFDLRAIAPLQGLAAQRPAGVRLPAGSAATPSTAGGLRAGGRELGFEHAVRRVGDELVRRRLRPSRRTPSFASSRSSICCSSAYSVSSAVSVEAGHRRVESR